MSSSAEDVDFNAEEDHQSWQGGLEDGLDSLALFDGDAGTLSFDVRRTLVALLRRQVLTRAGQPDLWDTLEAHHQVIVSRLHDLFLDLIIDRDRGVAYKIQVHAESGTENPILLRDNAYTREETILLVFLRAHRLSEVSAGNDHVFVDATECIDAVQTYRAIGSTDVAGEQQRAKKAILALRTAGILASTEDPERFAITPVIEVVLSLQRLRELAETLSQLNRPTAQAVVQTSAAEQDEDVDDESDQETEQDD